MTINPANFHISKKDKQYLGYVYGKENTLVKAINFEGNGKSTLEDLVSLSIMMTFPNLVISKIEVHEIVRTKPVCTLEI